MEPVKIDGRGPERIIQDALMLYLRAREWHVMETHGNAYQNGFPDLFVCHRKFGQRWIEVKKPEGYKFTPAQLEQFPLMCANGSGVWILTAANDCEYQKLFGPHNWYTYLVLMNQRGCK